MTRGECCGPGREEPRDQGCSENGGQVWKLGPGSGWGSSEQGLQPELEPKWELSGQGCEQREVLSSPAPSSCPHYSPRRGCWIQHWPCLKTSDRGCLWPNPLGPCSLLTLLLFKVDSRVLVLLFINFYAARSPRGLTHLPSPVWHQKCQLGLTSQTPEGREGCLGQECEELGVPPLRDGRRV